MSRLLYVAALVCFLLAMFGLAFSVNLVAAGLACCAVAHLV